MARIQGLAESGVLEGDTLLKTGKGYVFSITLSWSGATAGNRVYLRDGLDGAATPEVVFVLDAASGTYAREWTQGKEFDVGIFYDEGDASNVVAELTFK